MLKLLSYSDPGAPTPVKNILEQLLDYDHLYLAEHTMYGSSRLGIKKYWPTQYRYQWNKSKTVAQNDAALDTNELTHRVAWYYGPWQSLVSRTEREASGHANRTAFSSSRIVGQKGYELTNHLGNVMAVISDKVTEQRAVPNASLPATAVKRAGLSAAYDYYPFGMQMPGRVVEDATVQCIPITRTRQVEKIVASEDQIAGYDHFGGGMPSFVASGNNTNINYPLVIPNPGNRAVISSIYNPAVLDANMTFTALPAGTTGLMVDVTVQENNHPSVTGYNRTYIGVGTLTVELRNLASGGIGTFLTTTQLTGGGTARLTVPPNMVAPGNVIRLWMHYDAPTFPTWMYDWGYTPQAQIQYSAVVKHILKPVDQQYVALSCDTDGAYAATYRYGFNGQQKDDEIKGKGNSLDFGARMYDSRLGRWNSTDPHAMRYPSISTYAFVANNPILFVDPDGNQIHINGNSNYQARVFADIQKLTNTKLVMLTDGTVKRQADLTKSDNSRIFLAGTPNTAELKEGTRLVDKLVRSDKDHVVKEGNSNVLGNSTHANYGVAGTVDAKGRSGMGTGTTVNYDPDGNPPIANADGTKGRPAFIGLAHEFGHAEYYGDGKVDNTKVAGVVDPDSGQTGELNKEEIRNRVLDSKIRKEHKLIERAKPHK